MELKAEQTAMMESWWLFKGDKHNISGYVTHRATWRWPARSSLDIDKLQRKELFSISSKQKLRTLYLSLNKIIHTIHIVIITLIMEIHIEAKQR